MFKSAATKIAHNSTLSSLGGNKDLKGLQDLITTEKAVLNSLQRLSLDFTKASECLRTWGLGEGDDLGDILSASTTLLTHLSSALTQFAAHEQNVREHMKAVRTREEALDEARRRRKALQSKSDAAEKKLNKMSPEHKSITQQTELLNGLRDQIRNLDWEILCDEAKLGDFKRTATKNWMMLKFGGLIEFAEKATIVGELGRLVIDEIPLDVTQPGHARGIYTGYEKTEKFVVEAQRCVSEVVFDPQPISERDAQPTVNSPTTYNNNYGGSKFSTMGSTNSDFAPNDNSYTPSPRSERPPDGSFGHGPASFLGSAEQMEVGNGLGLDAYIAPGVAPAPTQQMERARFDEFGAPDRDRGGSRFGSMPSGPMRIGDDGTRVGAPQPEATFPAPMFPPGPGVNVGGGASGGQFATFPVRQRQGSKGAFQLNDGPAGNVVGGSFEADVASALTSGAGLASQTGEKGPDVADVPAPKYESTYYGSQLPPEKGAALPMLPDPWSAGEGSAPPMPPAPPAAHDPSDDESQLAYAAERPSTSSRSERRVRFGGSDEKATEEPSNGYPPGERERLSRRERYDDEETDDMPRYEYVPPKASEEEITPPEPQLQSQHSMDKISSSISRVPAPAIDDTAALNAAAAREISREFDALTFSPPTENYRVPSPLLPPAPPFAGPRAVSPGIPGSQEQGGKYASPPGAPPYNPYASPPNGPNDTPPNPPAAAPSQPPPPTSQTTASSTLAQQQQPLPPPPSEPQTRPALSIPGRPSFSSTPAGSDYGTPPEYPRTLSASSTSTPVRRTPGASATPSPMAPPMTTGTRTISASAFKRPQMRAGSESPGAAGRPDVGPLSFKKKTLPSTPYPPRMQSPDAEGGTPPRGSPSPAGGRAQPPPASASRQGAMSQEPELQNLQYDEPYDDGQGHYDLLASYGGDPIAIGSPAQLEFGRVGQVHGATALSSSPGYGQGRFATNLEERDGLR